MDHKVYEQLVDLADSIEKSIQACQDEQDECFEDGELSLAYLWGVHYRAHMDDLKGLKKIIKEMEV